MALITAAEAREAIPELTGTGEDTLLGTLIADADAVMAAWCGYPPIDNTAAPTLESATYTEFLDGPMFGYPRAIQLPVRPVISVTSIHSDPDWNYGASSLLDSDFYTLDKREGVVYLHPDSSDTIHSANRAIKAVFVAGYATAPSPIKSAARLMVRHLWQSRAIQTAPEANSFQSNASGIPKNVQNLLAPFRILEAFLG